MGEIAEMMLDGDLCEGCGVYMGSPGEGFPRRCRSCGDGTLPVRSDKVKCAACGKHVKATGLKDHQRAKHAEGGSKRG